MPNVPRHGLGASHPSDAAFLRAVLCAGAQRAVAGSATLQAKAEEADMPRMSPAQREILSEILARAVVLAWVAGFFVAVEAALLKLVH